MDATSIVANGNHAPAACGGIALQSSNTRLSVTDVNGDGLSCPGCDAGSTYAPADPFDYLRVAFFGIHHQDPQGSSPDCGSDVRRTLLATYRKLFDLDCPNAAAGCPSGIRHLWRGSEWSDATETFVRVVGGGAAVSKFCNLNGGRSTGNGQVLGGIAKNGYDFQDNDPIRVPCAGNGLSTGEQVCGDAAQGHLGTLGMLLTIIVPDPTTVMTLPDPYPVGLCTAGVVAALPATRSTYTGLCPSGGPSFGGRCYTSMYRWPDGSLDPNCIQPAATGRCPTLVPSGTDCRGANLWLRSSNGDIAIDTTNVDSLRAPPAPPPGRLFVGAFYRIHASTRMANGTASCQVRDSSEHISCLVGQASPCSLGVSAGLSIMPPAAALAVARTPLDVLSVQERRYPFSRELWINTLVGFENVDGHESYFTRCLMNQDFVANRLPIYGLIPLPVDPSSGQRIFCRSFDETLCGATANTDSCANNPTGFPTVSRSP